MDQFTQAFFEALLWSSIDPEGNSLDTFSFDDINRDNFQELQKECQQFQTENENLLELSGLSRSQCGHDFALTRNHHGAGFWDRGIGEVGRKLTEATHSYGEVNLLPCTVNGKIELCM